MADEPVEVEIGIAGVDGTQEPQGFIGKLKARETRVWDLGRMPGVRGIKGDINLSWSTTGRVGDLVAVTGAVDRSENYVFQVVPEVVESVAARMIPYWSVGDGSDTHLSLWNLGDGDLDLNLFLVLDGLEGMTFEYPIHLGAGRSRQVSFISLLEEPDAAGNYITEATAQGSAYFAAAEPERTFRVAAAAGTVNFEKATCSYYCISCEGYLTSRVLPTSVSLSLNETQPVTFSAQHVLYGWVNFSSSATWTSANTSRVQVSPGYVTGVGVTSSAVSVEAKKSLQRYESYYCGYDPICYFIPPVTFKANTSVTVVPPAITSISPNRIPLGVSTSVAIHGSGFGPGAQVQVAGSGVTATVQTITPTQITASFAVTGTATAGTRAVTVVLAGVTSGSQTVTIPTPHHLRVVSDSGGTMTACPTTVERMLTVQVVDSAGTSVGLIPVGEHYISTTSNTCLNGQPSPTPCANTDNAQSEFTDIMRVGCNSVGGSCGWSNDWQWRWCGPGSSFTNVGHLYGFTHNDAVRLNGKTMPPFSNNGATGTAINP